MTVYEAIKTLERLVDYYRAGYRGDDRRALKLGIEALKFFKDLEDRGALPADVRLPGETNSPS